MEKVIGIDLGTTNSAVAVVDAFTGKGECIMNKEGSTLTASAVCFKDKEELIIGNMARECKILYPESTATLFKRIIGIEKTAITVNGADYSPQAVSALVLKSLKADAEEEVGQEIHKAVITVPAYFDSNRRRATMEAGSLAGFDEVYLLDEPIAAVYAADAIKNYAGKTLLIFDLGGGTLDLVGCQVSEDTINEVVINGDIHLGGSDWSDAFVAYIKSTALNSEALDIEGEQELLNKTEQAKLTLSKKEETFFTVMTRNGRKEVTVTREEFETCTAHLLAKAMNVLADTKKSLEEKGIFKLDQIVLCGGATRMPQIIAGIKKIYGDINIYEKDVDQAVAKGAAIYASLLNEKQPEIQQNQSKDKGTTGRSGGSDVKAKELRCVTSRSYGILAFVGETEKKISNMIFQNTEVGPASKTVKAYYTKYDNQREVALKIYEDTMSVSHVDKEEGTFLGKCYLKIQGNLPQNSPIKVEMSLDENGTLFIRGSEESGKTEVTAYIETNALLRPDELVKERAQVEDVFVNVE